MILLSVRAKDAGGLKECKVKDETSSDSEDKVQKAPPLAKRKTDMEGAEVVEKRKKGRPRKDAKLMMAVPQAFPQVLQSGASRFFIFCFLLKWCFIPVSCLFFAIYTHQGCKKMSLANCKL